MIVMNTSLRFIRPLLREGFLKHHRKITYCTLAAYSNQRAFCGLLQGRQLQLQKKYSQWAPNIVTAPEPDIEIPNQLFTDFFWTKNSRWGNLTAVVCGLTGREIKYPQLRTLCRRLATSLLKEGFKQGEVIAIILPNMPEFPVATFGIIEAGLVVSTINPLYTADEIAYQLKNSCAAAIITIPEKLETVLQARDMLAKENKEAAAKLKIICTPSVLGEETDVPSNVDKFSRLVADDVDDSVLPSLQTKEKTPNDTAFIPYSSGTTGKPKGVCLTHKNLVASIAGMHVIGDMQDATSTHQDVVPCILPGFHIYGFTVVMGQSLYCGAKLVTLPKFEESTFLRVLKDLKSTILYVAPPLVIYMGQSPNVTKEHLHSVRVILSGAAPVADSDIMKCVAKSPDTVCYKQGYGLTETSPGVCAMRKGTKKYSSVGPAAPNTLIKIADLQTGQALGPNDEGEVCVKGPQVMKGYLNNEKATKDVFDDEGWFHTGDIGYYDEDKHFYITDRLKELIKVKGFQVAPAELEGLLRSHPDIADAGVIGVPDPRKGEVPIGFVQAKKGANPTVESLKAFLEPKIASYKQIDTFVFMESIPKSAAGKILRRELKDKYLNRIDLNGFFKDVKE